MAVGFVDLPRSVFQYSIVIHRLLRKIIGAWIAESVE
jgi:hypothetical protein